MYVRMCVYIYIYIYIYTIYTYNKYIYIYITNAQIRTKQIIKSRPEQAGRCNMIQDMTLQTWPDVILYLGETYS